MKLNRVFFLAAYGRDQTLPGTFSEDIYLTHQQHKNAYLEYEYENRNKKRLFTARQEPDNLLTPQHVHDKGLRFSYEGRPVRNKQRRTTTHRKPSPQLQFDSMAIGNPNKRRGSVGEDHDYPSKSLYGFETHGSTSRTMSSEPSVFGRLRSAKFWQFRAQESTKKPKSGGKSPNVGIYISYTISEDVSRCTQAQEQARLLAVRDHAGRLATPGTPDILHTRSGRTPPPTARHEAQSPLPTPSQQKRSLSKQPRPQVVQNLERLEKVAQDNALQGLPPAKPCAYHGALQIYHAGANPYGRVTERCGLTEVQGEEDDPLIFYDPFWQDTKDDLNDME
jgi:hypothetical protein